MACRPARPDGHEWDRVTSGDRCRRAPRREPHPRPRVWEGGRPLGTWLAAATVLGLICWLGFAGGSAAAASLGTAFVYQGHLSDGREAATGVYDFRFTLYDAPISETPAWEPVTTNAPIQAERMASRGVAVGHPIATNNVVVSNGFFGVALDFGPVFGGDARWLGVEVRPSGEVSFSALRPRQLIAPALQSLFAVSAGRAGYADNAGTSWVAAYATNSGSAQHVPWLALPGSVLTNGGDFDAAGAALRATNGLAAALVVTNWPGWTNGVMVEGAGDATVNGAYYWQGGRFANANNSLARLGPLWGLYQPSGRLAYRTLGAEVFAPWFPTPGSPGPAPIVQYMTGQLAVASLPVQMNGALITNLDAGQITVGQIPLPAMTQSLASALSPVAFTGVRTNVFNVLDYGAKGDGATDDHAAIEGAIQAALQVGGEVYFPARVGAAAIYNDSAGHYIFTNVLGRPCCLVRGGGPGVVWNATFTQGILANGFFDMEDIALQGEGAQYGVMPYPTNYCGIYEWGPWGTYPVLRRVSVRGFGYGLICHEANPRFYEVHAMRNRVGVGLGMQNDTALFQGCEVYYNTIGLETGCVTPPATNAPVPVPSSYAIVGSASVTANGMWDYNGTDFVLGGMYGSYVISAYGEAQTNCNVMVGHNPAMWPELAAHEASGYVRVLLQNCSWTVNPPPENVQLFAQALLSVRSTQLNAPCAIHSYTGISDASLIEADAESNLFGSIRNLLLSQGTSYAGLNGAWTYQAGRILSWLDPWGNLSVAGQFNGNLAGGTNYLAANLIGQVRASQIAGQLTNNTTGSAAYATQAGTAAHASTVSRVPWSALPGLVLTNSAAFDPAGSAQGAIVALSSLGADFNTVVVTNGLSLLSNTITLVNPPTGTPTNMAKPAGWVAITNGGDRYYLPIYH